MVRKRGRTNPRLLSRNPEKVKAARYPKKAEGVSRRGSYAIGFWPSLKLEKREAMISRRKVLDLRKEEDVKTRLRELGEDLNSLIGAARAIWPGTVLAAFDGELSLIFGHQLERPHELASTPVYGLQAGNVKKESGLEDEIEKLLERRAALVSS